MKNIFKNSFGLLIPAERKQFLLLSFFDVLICVLDIASLAILLFIVDFYIHPDKSVLPFLPAHFLTHNSALPIGIFLIFFSVKNLAGYWVSKMQYHFVYAAASRLSKKKMLQYLEGSYKHYVTVDTAVHIKKISQQPVEFSHYILSGLQQIITQVILVSFTIIAIVLFNATLFLLLLIILFPPVILVAMGLKKRTRAVRTQAKNNSEKALQYLKEALAGFTESNLYQRNDFFSVRYAVMQQRLNMYLSGLQSVQVIPGRLMEVFAVLGLFILILIGTSMGSETVSLLTIGAFMAAAYKMIPGVVKILNCSGTIRAYEYIIADLASDDVQSEPQQEPKRDSITSVEFKNISFSYHGKKILHGFNCVLQQGEMIGISGVSGKGKSTIINVLLGFENETNGQVILNEQWCDAAMRRQYWKKIAYVKQQPFLIHDTVITNITLATTNIDTERLQAAIRASGLDALVAEYPEGLEKIITENGKNISGGQRQRIVIARALYKNADLVILDEPFNELDQAAENKLLEHFKQLAQSGKMVILVTHNKKSLSFCNTIITLDDN